MPVTNVMADSRYDHLADDPEWRVIKRSALEGGNVLRTMIEQVKHENPKFSEFMMFSCIRDSMFVVPCEVTSKIPQMDPGSLSEGDVISFDEDLRFKPTYLEAGGCKFLPMFSSNECMENRFDDCPLFLSLSFDDCVDMAKSSGMDLIIDAFTGQLVIPIGLAEDVLTIPTRIVD